MSFKAHNQQHIFTRIACVIALLLLSFSHQPIALAKSNTTEFSAYLLPDGSLPVFCLTIDNDNGKASKAGKCEACRLSAGIAVPHAPALAKRISTPVLLKRTITLSAPLVTRIFPPSAPPRAPPYS